MKLTSEQASAWEKTRQWVQSRLDQFQSPRISDIAAFGQAEGLSRRLTTALLKKEFSSYRDGGRPVYVLGSAYLGPGKKEADRIREPKRSNVRLPLLSTSWSRQVDFLPN